MSQTMQAVYRKGGDVIDYTPATALIAGEVIQLADGRAAVAAAAIAAAIQGAVQVKGIVEVLKAASVVILDGAPIWWDHSANRATPIPQFADRDFYLGCAVGDYAGTVTSFKLALNTEPRYVIDINTPYGGGGGGGDTAVVLTAGTPSVVNRGGMLELAFSATAEAQKVDWMSRRTIPKGSRWIFEAMVEVVTNADADVADLTVGVANGTHASDFQSVTEFATFHFDMGADLDLDAQSDDGTTDVAPTDTTINWAEGTPIHLVIDGRDSENIVMYVNGVRVLSGTTFTLAAATGPLKAIVHLEKTSNDSPGIVQVDMLRVRIAEEA